MVRKTRTPKVSKIIVFDMDETIGAFPALSGILYTIQPYIQNYSLLKHFLDTNPQYIRPYMFDILKQVNAAKSLHQLTVMLYTNNSNSAWIAMILHYIDESLQLTKPLFDHVLDASQHKNYNKNVEDLLYRSSLQHKSKDARIFFVDDQYHPGMITPQVVYFHISPYKDPNPTDIRASQLLYKELREFINS